MKKTRVLTGITTTGTPHLGNYVGAIRPAIAASARGDVESFYFLADYHALIKCDDPARIERSRLEIAVTWLAAGLDPDKVYFYRQSDVPETTELTWLLTCVTAKGLMNRAHAYKASVDQNVAAGEDPDAGITMGLYSYPILMAADILLFNANRVPVGRDQIQHIEMARDIAARFNHLYGRAYRDTNGIAEDPFVLPEVVIEESVATLPGLDGRKMSKSYDNTIPLFDGGAKRLKETIARVVTDSKLPGEPKDPDSSHLVTLFRAFADEAEVAAFRADLAGGLGWGDAKQRLFERVERDVAPMRERYESLIAQPGKIETILQAGAQRLRADFATPFLRRLRAAVGLRSFVATAGATTSRADTSAKKPGRFVGPFPNDDGTFAFRFETSDGRRLIVGNRHESARDAGAAIKQLKGAAPASLTVVVTAAGIFDLVIGADHRVGTLASDGEDATTLTNLVRAELAALHAS